MSRGTDFARTHGADSLGGGVRRDGKEWWWGTTYLRRVAAERADVALHPLKRGEHVEQPGEGR